MLAKGQVLPQHELDLKILTAYARRFPQSFTAKEIRDIDPDLSSTTDPSLAHRANPRLYRHGLLLRLRKRHCFSNPAGPTATPLRAVAAVAEAYTAGRLEELYRKHITGVKVSPKKKATWAIPPQIDGYLDFLHEDREVLQEIVGECSDMFELPDGTKIVLNWPCVIYYF